ncbi:MAG: arsenate reductase ArsC [Verrucomicrobiae bacterium]|nr:arsenate reductase ArsC [Verrucomicrobiae bacterium]
MIRMFNRRRKATGDEARRRRVLFLCTGNSCRSQIAEGLINRLDLNGGRFEGVSAGTQPAGTVHPLTIQVALELHADLSRHRPKSWEEIRNERFDFVITLCDRARAAAYPSWEGNPVIAHWSFDDPIKCTGTDAEKLAVFRALAKDLLRCIEELIALPVEMLDRDALAQKLDRIGRE